MNTEQTLQIDCTSLEETLAFAEKIGHNLKGGETIELLSDLGGGKTTFTRGLVKGAGSNDRVHSPSFTISNQYETASLIITHFDFYRLDEPGIMRQELAETLNDTKFVTVVEWGEAVEDVLPVNRMTVRLVSSGENERQITVVVPAEYNYLINNISTSSSIK